MAQRKHALQLLAERDAEISRLNVLLSAQIAYGASVKARNGILLDAFDSMQANHDAELRAALASNERLREALARQRDIVSVAELERDDLRDAVVQLVERVELAHGDFTSWAHSRMRMPRVLDPLSPMPTDVSRLASSSELWAYASAMITSLRAILSAERRAHAETRTIVRVLEAQLARREEEMLHAGVRMTKPGRHYGARTERAPHIDEADVERARAENAVLEEEVRRLAERIHRAEVAAGKKKVADIPASSRSERELGSAATLHSAPSLPRSDERDPPHRRRQKRRSDSRSKSRTRRRSPTPTQSPPLVPSTSLLPPHLTEAGNTDPDPDRTVRPIPRRRPASPLPAVRVPDHLVLPGPDAHAPHESSSMSLHAEMDAEIEKLGSQIEAMTLERTRWLVLLSTLQGEDERGDRGGCGGDVGGQTGIEAPFEDRVERGVRDVVVEEDPPESPAFGGVVISADGRERDEAPVSAQSQAKHVPLSQAQPATQEPSLLPPSPPDDPLSLEAEYHQSNGNPLEDYDGSLSMELATPILPTVVLQSSQISPLDLDVSAGLPSVGGPRREMEGEADADAAVRELMDRASASASSGGGRAYG